MNDPSESAEIEARIHRAMIFAFALIVSPLVVFSIFLTMRAVYKGDPFGWLFGAAMLWFLIADHFLGKQAKKLVDRPGLPWMTEPRVNRLVDASVLSPIFAFCLIQDDPTGRTAIVD